MKTAASFLALASAGTLHQEFQKWKMTNLKSYSTEAEDSARFQVWRDNFDFVKEHNLRYLSGEETFTVEMNKFADMTEQEFANKMNMDTFIWQRIKITLVVLLLWLLIQLNDSSLSIFK